MKEALGILVLIFLFSCSSAPVMRGAAEEKTTTQTQITRYASSGDVAEVQTTITTTETKTTTQPVNEEKKGGNKWIAWFCGFCALLFCGSVALYYFKVLR